jgi:hypothetical protein
MMPLGSFADDVETGRALFSWDDVADPVVTGYKVHWGTSSGLYTHSVDAGNSTEMIIGSFAEGVTYFAAVTAYGSGGEESDYSSECSFVYTLPPSDLGTPGADPDGDGIPNLMEYALRDGDPAISNCEILPDLAIMTVDTRKYLSLTVEKNPNASGINYAVEVSGDLLTWSRGADDTVVVSETPESLVVRDILPLDDSTSRFLRLRVTLDSP